MRKICQSVLESEIAEIVLVVKVAGTGKDHDSLSSGARHLLYKTYNWLDRRVFHPTPDALECVSIEDLLTGLSVVTIEGSRLNSAEIDSIRNLHLDVVLQFGAQELAEQLAGLAQHGVWYYSYACEGSSLTPVLGFWDVMNEQPVMSLSLKRLFGQPATEDIIYSSSSPTLSRFSARVSSNSCYWKSSAFVGRKLADLYKDGAIGGRRTSVEEVSGGSPQIPGNAAMSRLFFKVGLRGAQRAFEKISSTEQWVLAFRIGDGDNAKGNEFKYLIPPAERFWADPFPVKVNGRYYIFFEEFVEAEDKAHISVIEIDKDGITSGPTPVLKCEFHLSYPFIFQWQGSYYMIPESGQRNVVQLYRSTSFPFNWEPCQVLLETNSPLDATLVEANSRWWMFVNIQEYGTLVNWDELHLYYAESPLGPWQPHARNPVVSNVESARPAGRLFWVNNRLYRPSQDSSIRYGYGLTLNEITTLDPNDYDERQVEKVLPDWDPNILGIHTLNIFEDITVIDCLRRRSLLGNERLSPPQIPPRVENLLHEGVTNRAM